MAVVFSTFFLLSPSSAQPPLIVSENVFNESGGGWVRISGVSSTYAWWWDLDSIGNQAHGIAFGPENGYLYLTSSGSHELMVFDLDTTDIPTGLLNFYSSPGFVAHPQMVYPTDVEFVTVDGRDMLYVANPNVGRILRFDATTLQFIDTWWDSGDSPLSLAVNNGNELFIVSAGVPFSNLLKVDAKTGAFLDGNGDGVFYPLTGHQGRGAAIGPNGNLYVSATDSTGNSGKLYQIDPKTGVQADGTLINSRTGGQLQHPVGIDFDDAGKLYVANAEPSNKILRYNATSLVFETVFQTGVNNFYGLAFVPDGCSDGIDNDGDGLVDFPDDPGCVEADDPGERYANLPCDNGFDDDGDGTVDQNDPGCLNATDTSEKDPFLPCDDGIDNDGDGRIDFDPVTKANPGDSASPPGGSGDVGCFAPHAARENPQCQDGIDNDGDTTVDYDAGLSATGSADPDGADSYCAKPWTNREKPGCGGSVSPLEGVNGPALCAFLLLLALCRPDPRRRKPSTSQRS